MAGRHKRTVEAHARGKNEERQSGTGGKENRGAILEIVRTTYEAIPRDSLSKIHEIWMGKVGTAILPSSPAQHF